MLDEENLVILGHSQEERDCLRVDLKDGTIRDRIPIAPNLHVRVASRDGDWLIAHGLDGSGPRQLIGIGRQLDIEIPLGDTPSWFARAAFDVNRQFVAFTREPHLTEVFSAKTGQLLHEFNGHLNGAKAVDFTPEGSRLITGVSGHDAFKFWDIREKRPLQLLRLEADAMFRFSIEFSPDGNAFGSADSLGTLHIWRAPSWEEIEVMDAEE